MNPYHFYYSYFKSRLTCQHNHHSMSLNGLLPPNNTTNACTKTVFVQRNTSFVKTHMKDITKKKKVNSQNKTPFKMSVSAVNRTYVMTIIPILKYQTF